MDRSVADESSRVCYVMSGFAAHGDIAESPESVLLMRIAIGISMELPVFAYILQLLYHLDLHNAFSYS